MGEHVFISYKHGDKAFVETLTHQLQMAGFRVWVDAEELRAGENWREAINDAIRDAFAVILIVTPEVKSSEYVTFEWAFALGAGVKIVPVMLEPTLMHPQLEMLQYLDFTDPARPPWDKLVRRLWEIQGEYQPHTVPVARDAPPSVKTAVAALDSHNAEERRSALRALSQTDHPSAYAALVSAVNHPLRDVRVDAGFMLAKRTDNGDSAAVPGLVDALQDEDARIRSAGAKVLGQIGDAAAVAPLLRVLGHERDDNVRWAATGALAVIGAAAVPGLVDALRDDDWKVRRSAAEALWAMGEPAAVPGLVEALLDKSDVVRQAAAGALEAMGVMAVNGLVEALHSPHSSISQAAADVLRKIGTDEALDAVNQWQRSQSR